eukprot:scaffold89169_cov21-Tisochrysis_lutea.AAC.6
MHHNMNSEARKGCSWNLRREVDFPVSTPTPSYHSPSFIVLAANLMPPVIFPVFQICTARRKT